jgi:hypothetical protein
VLDGGTLLGGHPERPFETLTGAEIRMHDLDRNHTVFNQVKCIEHSCIDTAAAAGPELVPSRNDPTVELCIHQCHGVQNATATRARSAVKGKIGVATAELRRNGGRMRIMERRHFDSRQRRLLVCSLVIGVGFVMVILGFQASVTGRKALALPPTIEDIDPVRGAVRVPSQTAVFVDLLSGYTGVLVIDGVELKTVDPNDPNDPDAPGEVAPGQQVTLPATTIYERGNATLTFVPTEGAPIESFSQGTHTATVIYWKVLESRQRSHSYTWTFSVF